MPATEPVSPCPAHSFLVGDDGRVYEGVGWNVQGTHTPGYSNASLGLAFFGSENGKVRADRRPARCLPCPGDPHVHTRLFACATLVLS